MVGKGLWRSYVLQFPVQDRPARPRLHRDISSWILNISKNEDFSTLLCNNAPVFDHLYSKVSKDYSKNTSVEFPVFPFAQTGSSLSTGRIWFYLLYTLKKFIYKDC